MYTGGKKGFNYQEYKLTKHKFMVQLLSFLLLLSGPFLQANHCLAAYQTSQSSLHPHCSSSLDGNYIIPTIQTWDGGLFNDSDDATDLAYDAAVDPEGNVVVTGYSFAYNDTLPILKYNATGSLLWNSSIPSLDKLEIGRCITTDQTGAIYLAGDAESYSDDAWLWKYSTTGEQLWNSTFGGLRDQNVYDLGLDSAGNILLTGYTDFWYVGLENQAFLCKFDPTGHLLWNRTFGGSISEYAFGLTIDSEDTYYLTGETLTPQNNISTLLLAYSSQGDLLWNRTFVIGDRSWGDSVILDLSERYLFVTGGAFDYSDNAWYSYLSKISASTGHLLWTRFNSVLQLAIGYDIVLDHFGDVLVAGITENLSSSLGLDVFLCKYDKTGDLLWQYTWQGSALDRCYGIAYSFSEVSGEHLYLVGETKSFGTTKSDILLLIIIDTDADGLTDAWEESHGTDPSLADSDFDGLTDYQEVAVYLTDPLDSDSDGDGWLDGKEVTWGTDPLNPVSNPYRRKIILAATLPSSGIILAVAVFVTLYDRENRLHK